MASNNSTEDLPAATDASNITLRHHRGRRIAAALVTCTLLGGTAIAITASGASAEPNDRCQSVTAVYENQIRYTGEAFGVYTTDVLLSQWANAALALDSYQKASEELTADRDAMHAACV